MKWPGSVIFSSKPTAAIRSHLLGTCLFLAVLRSANLLEPVIILFKWIPFPVFQATIADVRQASRLFKHLLGFISELALFQIILKEQQVHGRY